MTLSPGTRVGAYDIDSLLGAGGMGEVYKARDSRLQRSVAIKRWSHDGKQLFFRNGTAMMAVDLQWKGEQIEIGAERKLFDAAMAWEYDVAPNGDFYTLAPVPGAAFQTHIRSGPAGSKTSIA